MLGDNLSLAGVRVLVIDDRADDRDLWTIVLEGSGAEVVVAESIADGLEVFERTDPSILLCDITLPDGDGYALIRTLRARGDRISAVAVTGHALRRDVEAAFAAGFDAHLAKPVEPERLLAVVASLVTSKPAG